MNTIPWESPVKKKLRAGLPVFGAMIATNSVESTTQIANLGFDFLWIEMEHSPITLETLRNTVLAARGLPALLFARVPVNELWMAKRVLDAGVSGVIFPFTSTPELARQAVAGCRYPPRGRRGSGADLARFGWPDADRYIDSADENVTVIAMVEEARAVENIEEIAATPGVDVLFIGTSDLSFSLGLRGEQDHPKLREAVDKVLDAGRRHKKCVGRTAYEPHKVKGYLDQGFRLLAAPTEIDFIKAGVKQYFEVAGKP
jgi:2-keto-3-deoxy-L-rhamnonate aldolase RhmA